MKLTINLSLTSTLRIHGALPPISHTVLLCGGAYSQPQLRLQASWFCCEQASIKASFTKAKKKPDNARRVNVTFDRDPVTAGSYNWCPQ